MRTTSNGNSEAKSTSEGKDGRYSIAVLGKALDLIDALDGDDALTLTELSAKVGVPKATSLRILSNLEHRGYVDRDQHGQYRLGMRLLQLGSRTLTGLDLRNAARPAMKTLHAEFDETVNLAVPGENGIIYIDILESQRGLRMAASVGMLDDYHSSGLGKAILANEPAEVATRIVSGLRLTRKTPKTITSVSSLQTELDKIREQGFAVDEQENEEGARCIAAPIFDHRGLVIGALSLSGPIGRISPDRVDTLSVRVKSAAGSISRAMGWMHTSSRGITDTEN